MKSGEHSSLNEGCDSSSSLQDLLYQAIQNNDAKALRILSQHGRDFLGDFSDPRKSSTWSMLHWASYHGNEHIVKALLNCSAPSRSKACEHSMALESKRLPTGAVKMSPLHSAAQQGHLHVAWLLLHSSFSSHEVDNLGNTPLHLSSAAGHIRLVNFFLDDGAEVFKKNIFQNTPYDVAKTRECRALLKEAMERHRQPLSASESQAMHGHHLECYTECRDSLLKAIQNVDILEEQRLPKLRDLVRQAISLGLDTETVGLGSEMITWLELRNELREAINQVKEHMPVISQANYALLRQLKALLRKSQLIWGSRKSEADSRRTSRVVPFHNPVETLIDAGAIIQEGYQICNKSREDYLLYTQFLRVLNRPLSTTTSELICFKGDVAILKKRISLALSSDASPQIIEKASLLYDQRVAEMNLVVSCISNDAWPEVPQNDVGYLEQSEEYLDSSTRAQVYVWKSSKSLTQLQAAIQKAHDSVQSAVHHNASPEMLESSHRIIKEKEDLQKMIMVKDEGDKALAIFEAKKNSNKKKKKVKGPQV
jgi:hypothetical protein